jgi:hypothetical protein
MKNFKNAQRSYDNLEPAEEIDSREWIDDMLIRGEIDQEKSDWLTWKVENFEAGKITFGELEACFKVPF